MSESLYFFALLPDEPFSSRILQVQEELKAKFGLQYAMRLMPHISIQSPFECKVANDKEMEKIIREISNVLQPLNLEAKGPGFFTQPVIYITIADNPVLMDMQNKISEVLVCSRCMNAAQRNNAYIPHLSLAHRDLEPKRFEEVWNFLSTKDLHGEFSISRLQIFKYTDGSWVNFHSISMQSKLA
ncbi:MAG: hypothetical protein GC180_08280 [Bacteroidetes bacterium]|nr:hypothetical protein [Bacteroidota bacterium]